MVDVEISGILEEKLRRLVELGLYSSISEAVRDAVRRLLQQLDMRSLALKIFLGYSVCWIFYGISFYFLLKSLGPTIGIDIFQPIIIFVLAYQIGYLAFFAPGGIGVRELVLTKGLASFFGDVAIGVSIIARIWNLIVEIISALIALIIKIENDK